MSRPDDRESGDFVYPERRDRSKPNPECEICRGVGGDVLLFNRKEPGPCVCWDDPRKEEARKLERERELAFLKELAELTRRTGISISGCLRSVDGDGEYLLDKDSFGDDVTWIPDKIPR
jgi:hypothetical protein